MRAIAFRALSGQSACAEGLAAGRGLEMLIVWQSCVWQFYV
jgi:hypothetical protein